MDQLELRIAASRWNSAKYLQAFEDGLDPHSSVTAFSVFGKKFEDAAIECGAGPYPWKTGTKFSGNAKKLRNLSKAVAYASQYAASVETVHRIITQTEVDNGDGTTMLPYLSLSVREVRMMHQNWAKGAQYQHGWQEELQAFRTNGFLAEPIMGRRRDFLDGENINEIVNYPIQASASSLMNIALLRLREEIPMWKWGYGTGIINQCHDAIVVECPEDKAEWVRQVMQDCMNLEFDCLPGVKFTAEAELGTSWKDVG
jgi:DNA polymerase I-like protein with 3'-5' exonuclease and polymerase domains